MGHISPSTAARSTNCSAFLKVSISQVKAVQNYRTLALWEAASGLWSGKLGYGSPDPLARATETRAQRLHPTAEVPKAWDSLDVAL